MKKTLILSALMAVAVTFMSCTSDTDDGISPAVLVSLQQQQEAEQELYKKNEKISGTWSCEYDAKLSNDFKATHTMKLSKNGKGTDFVIYSPEHDFTEVTFINKKIDKEETNFSYELDIKNNKITFPYVYDGQIDGENYHIDVIFTAKILKLTDTSLIIQIEDYDNLNKIFNYGHVFGGYSEIPEITTWTKLQ